MINFAWNPQRDEVSLTEIVYQFSLAECNILEKEGIPIMGTT